MDADFFMIQKMRNGDDKALEQFVRKYYPLILNYCRYHTSGKEAAEDLTQETFERFFRTFSSYRHSGKLANYLYVIAGNLCRDDRKKRYEWPMEELPETGANPFGAVNGRLDVEQAVKAPISGMIFTRREYPVVYSGSLLGRILGGGKA